MNTQETFIDPETGQIIKDNFSSIGDIIKEMNIAGDKNKILSSIGR